MAQTMRCLLPIKTGVIMKIYSLLIVFLILAGCSTNPSLQTASPHPLLATSTVWQPTAISTATQPTIVALTPTRMPSSGYTISTPSEKDSSELTLELLRTNNGCDLPCWWGIVPNQTTWANAEDFLKPFSNIYERQPTNEWSVYDIGSPVSKEFSELGEVSAVFAAQDGLVKEIKISGFDEKTYHLSSFLQNYGVPAKILISAYSSGFGRPEVPLSVDLYYPEKGINALYGIYASIKGTQIYGCEKSPVIFLWASSEYDRSLDYILHWDTQHIPYKDIQEATGLSIQNFYSKYKNPENAPCLQTPVNLWPSQ